MRTHDFSFAEAASVLFPDISYGMSIIQIGCGGTGSWLAPDVARIIRSLGTVPVKYTIYDPDVVEHKNVLRQNFCDAEIGSVKSVTLATRLTHAWGVEIGAVPLLFKAQNLEWNSGSPLLFIGCVDNEAARREIREALRNRVGRNCWWLDCGNHVTSGQVLLGNVLEKVSKANAFPFPGKCVLIPAPSVQHPELLESPTLPEPTCEDQPDAQGLTVNRMVAAIAADYVLRLLTHKDLRRYASYFDLASMAVSSRYIQEKAWSK